MSATPAAVLWRCSGTRRNYSVKFNTRQYQRIVVIEYTQRVFRWRDADRYHCGVNSLWQ